MKHTTSTIFNRRVLKTVLSTAVALSIGLGVNSYADAASATSISTAKVLVPIAISKTRDLAFGSFAPGVGGTITVSTSGARTKSGTILSSIGVAPSAAQFAVTGDGVSTYSISFTNTPLASTATPGDVMPLAIFSDFTGGNATTGTVATNGGTLTAGAQTIYVGGTATVGASQPFHADYAANIIVAVEYN
ncbi:DUF4402 domain-containing protein [Glaciimonas immobilis]|uniref:DUF4402 domain-containing protein n=1 Tax=Glaciimonas immobilis TaxID=728004 RepID=A0A840RXK3_9BURK|nr:DUF4402 domain-containing protein [Glaciimonas immobilis]KAF3998714.1 DUF4402 domain-containing protein [Glaciimonas immobilis]MBB5201596.1 hypothetical protein [Glaciimonas immobilis]